MSRELRWNCPYTCTCRLSFDSETEIIFKNFRESIRNIGIILSFEISMTVIEISPNHASTDFKPDLYCESGVKTLAILFDQNTSIAGKFTWGTDNMYSHEGALSQGSFGFQRLWAVFPSSRYSISALCHPVE